jgi:hypothetical protein
MPNLSSLPALSEKVERHAAAIAHVRNRIRAAGSAAGGRASAKVSDRAGNVPDTSDISRYRAACERADAHRSDGRVSWLKSNPSRKVRI